MAISPAEKKLLEFGIPIGLAVVGLFIAHASSSSAGSSTTGTIAGTTATGDGSAVDSGQLASFESDITAEIAALGQGTGGESPTPKTGVLEGAPPFAKGPTKKTSSPSSLPELNAASFAKTIGAGAALDIGTITGKGGTYTGENVTKGAPVYFNVGGELEQGLSGAQIAALPKGTEVAVAKTQAGYVTPTKRTETIR